MGIYDLTAAINYTSNMLNDSLMYIGFSQGTTQFYVMASEKPQFAAEKVKVSFNLSPIAFMSNAVSPLRLLAPPPLSYLVEVSTSFITTYFLSLVYTLLVPNCTLNRIFIVYTLEVNYCLTLQW